MKSIALAVMLLALLASASGAVPAVSIELRAPDGSCHLDVVLNGQPGNLTVVARGIQSLTCCPGFTGAEFRIAGWPTGWLATALPSADSYVSVGSLFGDGVNIGFPQTIMTDEVVLYTVTFLATSMPQPLPVLTVRAHNHPSYPYPPWSECPWVAGGDCPCDPALNCVAGGALYINATGDCTLAVQPTTWSAMKTLYN